jgi:hypothetical protein
VGVSFERKTGTPKEAMFREMAISSSVLEKEVFSYVKLMPEQINDESAKPFIDEFKSSNKG